MEFVWGEVNTTKKNLNTEPSKSLPRFATGISRTQDRSVTAWAKFLGPHVLVGMYSILRNANAYDWRN